MQVTVIPYGLHSAHTQGDGRPVAVDLPEGSMVSALLQHLDIPAAEVSLIVVNGAHVQVDRTLRDGDRVKLFAPVGGG
jgi:molybdopterin synthase sulfur carrier subunit